MPKTENMKSRIVFVVIGLIFIIACHKDKERDIVTTEAPEALIGTWNWLYSSGGFAGITETPQSTGEIKKIEFDRESNFRTYVNNVLKIENKYRVEKGKTITSRDSVPILTTSIGLRQSISFRTADTLILFDECFDCFEHYFKRIN